MACLVVCFAAYAGLTGLGPDNRAMHQQPLWAFVLLLMLAAVAYLWLVKLVLRFDFSRRALKLAILTGLALRLLLFFQPAGSGKRPLPLPLGRGGAGQRLQPL